LFYNWNRYYDPSTGRYIESDPIGLAGGLNTFSYALNQPTRYVDPTGNIAIADDLVIGIGLGVGAILMSPPGQVAIKKTVDAISELCTPGDPCDEIIRQIRDIAGKLRSKLAQQNGDQYNLFDRAYASNPGGELSGKGTWIGHDAQLTGLKLGLQRKILQARSMNCLVPPDVILLANTPNPTRPFQP
jgi:uncharacterized protein RhaS with RHS repeats